MPVLRVGTIVVSVNGRPPVPVPVLRVGRTVSVNGSPPVPVDSCPLWCDPGPLCPVRVPVGIVVGNPPIPVLPCSVESTDVGKKPVPEPSDKDGMMVGTTALDVFEPVAVNVSEDNVLEAVVVSGKAVDNPTMMGPLVEDDEELLDSVAMEFG